jgi:hypothetical protein
MGETTGGPATPSGPGADPAGAGRAAADLIDELAAADPADLARLDAAKDADAQWVASAQRFARYAELDHASGLDVTGTPASEPVVRHMLDRMRSLGGEVSAWRHERRYARLVAVAFICILLAGVLGGLIVLGPWANGPRSAEGVPVEQAGAGDASPGGAVAPSPSAVAPSPSAELPSPSAVAAPSPSAEYPSPSTVSPSPSAASLADDCPGMLLGSFDVDSILAATTGSQAAKDAFAVTFPRDCISLDVDPSGLAAGEEEVTGSFLLAVDETDITNPASRSCVISIVWKGKLTGVYDVEGTNHIASGIGTGTTTRSMTDGCTAVSSADRKPASMKIWDITWQVSGDGQTMAGDFMVVQSEGDGPRLWKVELAAR